MLFDITKRDKVKTRKRLVRYQAAVKRKKKKGEKTCSLQSSHRL